MEEADRLRAVESASTMLATGEELVAVVEQCGEEIGRLLGLERCYFEASPGGVAGLRLERDGRLVVPSRGSEARGEGSEALTAELPVLGLGEELGHFVLVFGPSLPRRDQLLVAVTLADQAGAAIATQVPAGGGDPGPPIPAGPLRLLR